jgi:hypothetical protein
LRAPGPVCRQHDQRQRAQRRGGADLVEAAVRVDSFEGGVERQAFPDVAFHELSLYRPLLRSFCITQPFRESVDQDEAADVIGIGAGVKRDNQAAVGVAG